MLRHKYIRCSNSPIQHRLTFRHFDADVFPKSLNHYNRVHILSWRLHARWVGPHEVCSGDVTANL